MKICDQAWSSFMTLAQVCYWHDEEAEPYDVFNTWRIHFLDGLEYTDRYIAQLDAQIEREYQKGKF